MASSHHLLEETKATRSPEEKKEISSKESFFNKVVTAGSLNKEVLALFQAEEVKSEVNQSNHVRLVVKKRGMVIHRLDQEEIDTLIQWALENPLMETYYNMHGARVQRILEGDKSVIITPTDITPLLIEAAFISYIRVKNYWTLFNVTSHDKNIHIMLLMMKKYFEINCDPRDPSNLRVKLVQNVLQAQPTDKAAEQLLQSIAEYKKNNPTFDDIILSYILKAIEGMGKEEPTLKSREEALLIFLALQNVEQLVEVVSDLLEKTPQDLMTIDKILQQSHSLFGSSVDRITFRFKDPFIISYNSDGSKRQGGTRETSFSELVGYINECKKQSGSTAAPLLPGDIVGRRTVTVLIGGNKSATDGNSISTPATTGMFSTTTTPSSSSVVTLGYRPPGTD